MMPTSLLNLLTPLVLVTWLTRQARLIRPNLVIAVLVILAALVPLGVINPPLAAQASATSGAVFLRHKVPEPILNDQTDSMSAGVDGAGGMHAAFTNFSTDANGNYNAYYDYCAPVHDCANAANWTLVNLMSVDHNVTIMQAAQLAVNAQGHPRVVVLTTDNSGNFSDHYNYAACDGGCTNAANWTVVDVADTIFGNSTNSFEANKHFFALDPQGRPRIIVDNGVNYEYHSCNLACLGPGNWISVTLDGTSDTGLGTNTASLAFNAAGQPRLLAPVQDLSFQTNLNYWECNTTDCSTNAASWSTVPLVSPISGLAATYSSLRMTTTGEPRFAYYGTPGGSAESLYYYWCHGTCSSGANWHFSSVGLVPAANPESSGQEPDLALDSQNHPRLTFQTVDHILGNGLGYAWCNLNCESGSPTWQKLLADSNNQLNSDWNRLPPAGCTGGTWIGGYRSSLALDGAGNPRIGYDAEHFSTNCPGFVQDYRSVRFVYLGGGAAPGPYRLYLPLTKK